MEAHGGRVWRAGPGRGLTFTISVVEEAGIDAATGPAQLSARSRRAEREQARILVVDDDPQALRYVRDALSKRAIPIVTGDPEEVSRLMETNKPHLVLLDLILPGSDGIEGTSIVV